MQTCPMMALKKAYKTDLPTNKAYFLSVRYSLESMRYQQIRHVVNLLKSMRA